MTLKTRAKALLRLPFTESELRDRFQELLDNVRLVTDFSREPCSTDTGLETHMRREVREHYARQLQEISAERTWEMQRKKALEISLSERDWAAVHVAAKDLQFISSWKHSVVAHAPFKSAPEVQWKGLLAMRYVLAVTSGAYVETTGAWCYSFGSAKATELKIFSAYDREIRKHDFGINDQILRFCEETPDQANGYEMLRTTVLGPVVREQYALLLEMRRQIVAHTLDLEHCRAEMQRLADLRSRIAHRIKG